MNWQPTNLMLVYVHGCLCRSLCPLHVRSLYPPHRWLPVWPPPSAAGSGWRQGQTSPHSLPCSSAAATSHRCHLEISAMISLALGHIMIVSPPNVCLPQGHSTSLTGYNQSITGCGSQRRQCSCYSTKTHVNSMILIHKLNLTSLRNMYTKSGLRWAPCTF